MKRVLVLTAALLLAACSGSNNGSSNNGTTNNGSTNNGATNNGATNNGATNNGVTNNGVTNNGATNNGATNNGTTGDPVVMLSNPDDCYAFSDDVDIPLALDGAFDATSPVWRRPHDENDVCPAPALLPDTAATVPYLAVKFCNTDSVDHVYDFELFGQDGPAGEPPLDDAYLVLYEGEDLPADHRQCLLANDDIPGAIDSGDSEILGVTVPAGGAITVMATTFTFAPDESVGTGGYILVVSNAD